ncbi:MAG: hypothetical protein M3065_21390, partial [Actinomycetota bacterium]|nr:hypothetical protein [Actinomycetota bacterium]
PAPARTQRRSDRSPDGRPWIPACEPEARAVERRTTAEVIVGQLPDLLGVSDHLRLAWFVSTVATVGGALGPGLESNRAVRAAVYRDQPDQSDD